MTLRFLSILLLCTLGSYATEPLTYPTYRQYTLRDGLSQMQVISLFQDSCGYIWAGTKEGVNCFNGEKFISFTDKDGLVNENINQIKEDFFFVMYGFVQEEDWYVLMDKK